MVWKPSCKGGSAKGMYQDVAPDPGMYLPPSKLTRRLTTFTRRNQRSFNASCNIPEPPKYKATKITLEQLYDIFDTNYVETSIRYGSLRITSPNINVKWNKESGEFSLSGTYGL
ncbi:hypothetical protein FRC05_001055 [Tulasnella sp. 425]|nr:hypothetical protein FRC05_001055 [Tulasnella sp. 425]